MDRLVRAFERVRGSLPGPWQLVIVGPAGWGHEPARLPGPTASSSPAPSDPVLAGLYRRARAFAYVPLTEGYGLPPLEAMRAGDATVVSDEVPSVHDLGAAGPTGAHRRPARRRRHRPRTGRRPHRRGGARRSGGAGPPTRRADVAPGSPGPCRAVAGAGVTDALALSLDVSAVPERPAVPATTRSPWPAAWPRATTSALTLVARRGDEVRWRMWPAAPPCGPPSRLAPGPARLRAGRPALAAALTRRGRSTTVRTTRCPRGRRCPAP